MSQIGFPAMALLCGMLGGYQFPVASRVFFSGTDERSRGAGALYALDLTGACVGAIVLSTYLVPVFGFFQAALLMALVNLAPAGLTVTLASRHYRPL